MTRDVRISQQSISRIAVHGMYYITHLFFFPREISTYNKWFSRSNKRSLSERSSLLSRYELIWIPFDSVLTFLYFYTITNFYFHSHHYCYDYFCYYCFCHCPCHYFFFIFNAFNFYFSSFCHSILSLCVSNIFKWRGQNIDQSRQ